MSTPNNGWQTGGGWGAPQPGSGPAQQPSAPSGGWGPASTPGSGWSVPPQPQPQSQPQPSGFTAPSSERETQSFGRPAGGFSGGSRPDKSAPESAPHSAATAPASFETTSAPHMLLLPSLILALISLIIDAVVGFGSLRSIDTQWGVLTGVAWALSGIVGVSALGLYFTKNTEARANGLYEIVGWKQALFYATIAALVIAVVISSVMFALWFGRQ